MQLEHGSEGECPEVCHGPVASGGGGGIEYVCDL